MTKRYFMSCLGVWGSVMVVALTFGRFAEASEWTSIKSEHFIVEYEGAGSPWMNRVLDRAEDYYRSIANAIGFSRRDHFWLWNARCRIFLYTSKNEYLAKTGQPEWSSGYAVSSERMIVSYREAPEFLERVLPHEIAHLILRDFLGKKVSEIPLWLDEGVAMAQETQRLNTMDETVRQLVQSGRSMPLRELAAVRSLERRSKEEAEVFYAQSQSVIRYLLKTYGSGNFLVWCRFLRNGADTEKMLARAFSKNMTSWEALEREWLQWVR